MHHGAHLRERKKLRKFMHMTFTRIRTINGRQYLYEEYRWREGGKVRSRSRCLGATGSAGRKVKRRSSGLLAFLQAQRLSPEERAIVAAEKEAARIEQYQRELYGETAQEREERERQEHLDKLHAAYGLTLGPRNPTPVELQPASAAVDTEESPAEPGPAVAPAGGLE
jgi:hypothetical protein